MCAAILALKYALFSLFDCLKGYTQFEGGELPVERQYATGIMKQQ